MYGATLVKKILMQSLLLKNSKDYKWNYVTVIPLFAWYESDYIS